MMKAKKLLIFSLFLVLIFTLCACDLLPKKGTGTSSSSDATDEESVDTVEEDLEMDLDEMYRLIRSAYDNSDLLSDKQVVFSCEAVDPDGTVFNRNEELTVVGRGNNTKLCLRTEQKLQGQKMDADNSVIYIGKVGDTIYAYRDVDNKKYSQVLEGIDSIPPQISISDFVYLGGRDLLEELFDADTPAGEPVITGKKYTKGNKVSYQFTMTEKTGPYSEGVLTIKIQDDLLQTIDLVDDKYTDWDDKYTMMGGASRDTYYRFRSNITFNYNYKDDIVLPSFEEYPLQETSEQGKTDDSSDDKTDHETDEPKEETFTFTQQESKAILSNVYQNTAEKSNKKIVGRFDYEYKQNATITDSGKMDLTYIVTGEGDKRRTSFKTVEEDSEDGTTLEEYYIGVSDDGVLYYYEFDEWEEIDKRAVEIESGKRKDYENELFERATNPGGVFPLWYLDEEDQSHSLKISGKRTVKEDEEWYTFEIYGLEGRSEFSVTITIKDDLIQSVEGIVSEKEVSWTGNGNGSISFVYDCTDEIRLPTFEEYPVETK
ncbi:MAG: hypothetical protein IJ735_01570 [Clostridia bacterium]|nr:hypothetical protein [Clostridia bacterium]